MIRISDRAQAVLCAACRTYISHDAREDDLLLSGGLNSGAEVAVVPRVDLAGALDERRVGVHVGDLLGERAVGACRNASAGWTTRFEMGNTRTSLRAGGQDRREVENLANRSVGENVSAVLVRFDVVDELEESDLMVNHEKNRVVLVEAHVFESFKVFPISGEVEVK